MVLGGRPPARPLVPSLGGFPGDRERRRGMRLRLQWEPETGIIWGRCHSSRRPASSVPGGELLFVQPQDPQSRLAKGNTSRPEIVPRGQGGHGDTHLTTESQESGAISRSFPPLERPRGPSQPAREPLDPEPGAGLQEGRSPACRHQPADGPPQPQATPWRCSPWQQRGRGTRAPATSACPHGHSPPVTTASTGGRHGAEAGSSSQPRRAPWTPLSPSLGGKFEP